MKVPYTPAPRTPQRDDDPIDQYLGDYYDPRQYGYHSEEPEEEKKPPLIVRFFKTVSFYIVVVLVCLFINFFIVRLGLVNGSSMEPTLTDRDMVVIWQPMYDPAPGDVVVTTDDNTLGVSLTKRVIATGGQHLLIDGGGVYVDGVALNEDYLAEVPAVGTTIDMVVPDGYVFVMGDNRNASFDSREMGALPVDEIMGKVILRIFPFNHITTIS